MTDTLRGAGRRGRGGAGWLLVATTSAGAVNYGYALAMTHGLAPAEFAAFAAGQALLLVRTTISSAAVSWVLAREVGRAAGDPERQAVVTSFAFWSNLVLGAGLTVLLVAGVLLFGSVADAALLAAASLILAVGSTGMGYLQGTGRITAIAGLLTLEALVKAATGAGLVFGAHWQSAGALGGFAAGGLVLLAPVLAARRLLRRPTWGPAQTELLRAAVRQVRLQANVAVTSAADTVIVAVLGLASAAAPYQAASALGRVPLFVSNAVSTANFAALSRDGSARRKADAIRTYLLVAAVMAAALITLPAPIRRLLLPDTFAAVDRWLPFAAVLGLAVGLLNLVVTVLQADDVRGSAVRTLTGTTVAYLAVAGLSGLAYGVAGVAVSATVAALSVVLLPLLALPSLRPAVRVLLTRRRSAGDLAVLMLLATALAVVDNPAGWVAVAGVSGAVALAMAFPEFAPRRWR
ncbi:hypothetical protein [Actinoplanes sp. NPDC048796]|uniref:hypothetical protein n=1 Tax=unclassified Actinoplanes TaxID=2626549 RepID=UPI003402AC27